MGKRGEKKRQRAELERAKKSLEEIHGQLTAAYARFEEIRDPVLTDACVYEINALRAQYDYALQNLKRMY